MGVLSEVWRIELMARKTGGEAASFMLRGQVW